MRIAAIIAATLGFYWLIASGGLYQTVIDHRPLSTIGIGTETYPVIIRTNKLTGQVCEYDYDWRCL
jgi:hypothetical protein